MAINKQLQAFQTIYCLSVVCINLKILICSSSFIKNIEYNEKYNIFSRNKNQWHDITGRRRQYINNV